MGKAKTEKKKAKEQISIQELVAKLEKILQEKKYMYSFKKKNIPLPEFVDFDSIPNGRVEDADCQIENNFENI